MAYTLTFSVLKENKRIPYYKDNREVSLTVEADSKTSTYSHPAVKALCEDAGNDCRVRRVQ